MASDDAPLTGIQLLESALAQTEHWIAGLVLDKTMHEKELARIEAEIESRKAQAAVTTAAISVLLRHQLSDRPPHAF